MSAPKRRAVVTTRRGDGGYTSLWGGDEVPKYDLRPEAFGTLDEACMVLSLARVRTRHDDVRRHLLRLHNDLYRLMAELASGHAHGGEVQVDAALVLELEARVVEVRERCELPERFTIPATETSAIVDLARTVIRRAERGVARLLHEGLVRNPETLRFLNRASDLAFLLARLEERLDGVPYQTISREDLA
jgi:cob(I)alamin adenosyltransferase